MHPHAYCWLDGFSPKSSRILGLGKRKLQLLLFVLIRRQNEEAKAGAFAYLAGESMFIWKSGLIINFDKNELLSLTCQSEPC